VATSPDYSPVCSPDCLGPPATSLDSLGPIPIGLGAAADLFCAAKAAEGSSPRTVEWYRMILIRAVRRFGEARPDPGGRPAGLSPRAPLDARARIDRRLRPGSQGLRQLVRGRGGRRGGWLPRAASTEGAAPAHRPVLRSGAAQPPRPRRRTRAGRGPSRSSCSTPASGCPSSRRCGSATSGPTGRSMSWARAPRTRSERSSGRFER
jgi:hypothetical protein